MHDLTSVSFGRREFLKRSALAGAGLAAAPVLPKLGAGGLAPQASPQVIAAPTGHCKWGCFAQPRRGQGGLGGAILALEQKIDRRFAIHRNYMGMDGNIIDKECEQLGSRIPYRSFHAWTRKAHYPIPWRAIANGEKDAWLREQAARVRDYGRPVYLCFHHEPDDDTTGNIHSQTYQHRGCGQAADFRAAYNHVRQIFSNANNVTWVAVTMAATILNHRGDAWFDGVNYDILGADSYNRAPFRGPWKTFREKNQPVYEYARSKGKRLFIGEIACADDPNDPSRKAEWITQAASVMQTWGSAIEGIMWSHTDGLLRGETQRPMNFWLDSSPQTLQAFTRAGHLPFFN
jgi:hypothetical protein